jgi:hypothetical protein
MKCDCENCAAPSIIAQYQAGAGRISAAIDSGSSNVDNQFAQAYSLMAQTAESGLMSALDLATAACSCPLMQGFDR